ncbi:hypothetical protein [Streptomyces cavernicola]|uniref:Integral membrane protein n=1 Tax=Streptomyces cavernicola TaxID=3043613 RepID=A0ABT6SAF2_9ACTN|nr:hypothetical protein [Streptomyces sp. B-S-A6]MDI3404662.1 hypothetical protein [Streptomyces sp. B-S-A6]
MPGSTKPNATKTLGVATVAALVAVTGYTVALGSNGWLWFGWIVLGLITAAVALSKPEP